MEYIFGEHLIAWLDENEVYSLIAKSRNPLLLEFIYAYGLRRGEVGLIRREDVGDKSVFIHRLKRKKPPFGEYLPLENKLRERVHAHLKSHNHPFLFPGYNKHGQPQGVSGGTVYQIWKNVFPERGPHILRHSRAGWQSEHNKPFEECQSWLGHRSATSTAVYYRISAKRFKRMAQEMMR